MLVVPEPSERWTTLISVAGRVTPGFSAAIAASFHFLILPSKMPAMTSGVILSGAARPFRLYAMTTAPNDDRDLDGLAVRRCGRDLAVLQEGVGSAEVDRVLLPGLDAAAGADRLVVELHAALGVVVRAPLGEQRIWEGGAGAVDRAVALGAAVGVGRGGSGCSRRRRRLSLRRRWASARLSGPGWGTLLSKSTLRRSVRPRWPVRLGGAYR